MNSLSKVVIRASEISCPKTEGQPSSHSSDKLVQTIQQDGVTSGGEASISPKSPELGGGAASSTDDFMAPPDAGATSPAASETCAAGRGEGRKEPGTRAAGGFWICFLAVCVNSLQAAAAALVAFFRSATPGPPAPPSQLRPRGYLAGSQATGTQRDKFRPCLLPTCLAFCWLLPSLLLGQASAEIGRGNSTADFAEVSLLNTAVQEMWPEITSFIRTVLKETVEEAIQTRVPWFLSSDLAWNRLGFGRISFGDSALKVEELLVCTAGLNVERTTQTSHKDGEVRSFKVSSLVAWDADVDVALTAPTAVLSAEHVLVNGRLDVCLQHILPRPPFFTGITFYFADLPKVALTLEGTVMGLRVSLAWLEKLLADIIQKQLAEQIVLPTVATVLLDITNEDAWFEAGGVVPEGVMTVCVHGARGLAAKDVALPFGLSRPSSDPYCLVAVGGKPFRTPTRPQNLNPQWSEAEGTHKFLVYSLTEQFLTVDLYDENPYIEDTFLGSVCSAASDVVKMSCSMAARRLPKEKPLASFVSAALLLLWCILVSGPLLNVMAAAPTSPTARTFHRRPLPEPAIAFSSSQGQVLFTEALAAGGMGCFFRLIEQFHTQAEPAYCGLGTLAMVLNALGVDPGRKWKGPWRWFSEDLLDCCEPLEVVKEKGVTFGKVVCLARCNGAQVDAHRVDEADVTEEDFRKAVTASCETDPGCGCSGVVVVSYSRKLLGQTGDGHYSPIGGYHRASDHVLILDVARFKYPPHWVPMSLLWEAMQRTDAETGRSRGFMVLRSKEALKESCLQLVWKTDSEEAVTDCWTMVGVLQSFSRALLSEPLPEEGVAAEILKRALRFIDSSAMPLEVACKVFDASTEEPCAAKRKACFEAHQALAEVVEKLDKALGTSCLNSCMPVCPEGACETLKGAVFTAANVLAIDLNMWQKVLVEGACAEQAGLDLHSSQARLAEAAWKELKLLLSDMPANLQHEIELLRGQWADLLTAREDMRAEKADGRELELTGPGAQGTLRLSTGYADCAKELKLDDFNLRHQLRALDGTLPQAAAFVVLVGIDCCTFPDEPAEEDAKKRGSFLCKVTCEGHEQAFRSRTGRKQGRYGATAWWRLDSEQSSLSPPSPAGAEEDEDCLTAHFQSTFTHMLLADPRSVVCHIKLEKRGGLPGVGNVVGEVDFPVYRLIHASANTSKAVLRVGPAQLSVLAQLRATGANDSSTSRTFNEFASGGVEGRHEVLPRPPKT
ncbi:Glutathione gamma-glutamylcysteinyltransferase 1 [Symbiodinium microadriaticum]|uniref:glutathione gamma-glutamylcysteinyltransferase n=1 Tax=Symbiodinium microadriaticum TaxID=2951 RepID=A0A1Q9EBZ8_SYMMI|nr:Glutathione gamma-glutamylcysteinyltransferase 1 [Symbiodinium microadriaticum]